MKITFTVVLLLAAGLAHAHEHIQNGGSRIDEVDTLQAVGEFDTTQKLSRQKRSVAPVVGMLCEDEYKLIGDTCEAANIPFE